ncbi:hypothetical protein [Cerasicoccus arenae]|uniref:Uncharacterized protein n=1 Tax=Cerasicoccus arenae TaxID=424488 RepID=A0A8J3DCL8_9BACT|nr:hypothetical protein [Cerasicoccus arenae]MBK1859694.1 hypothetical protein [Cerasicoccus arenae]GHC03766.1 hypothetical protein GCM10007047_20570 [Cerasicoccus arenae]
MSKLPCPCGKILSDSSQDDLDLSWGTIVPNGKEFEFCESASKLVVGLCESYKNGNHIEWIKKNCPVYTEQALEEIIYDLLSSLLNDLGPNYGSCDACGRLMIQRDISENYYVPYLPEDERSNPLYQVSVVNADKPRD